MSFPDRMRTWLTFSRNQRKAILAMFLLIGISMLFPLLITRFYPEQPLKIEIITGDSLQARTGGLSQASAQQQSSHSLPNQLFYFDPNTATLEDWLRLGISKHTAVIILHYREKGGRFRKKEDLMKIYGFQQADYQRLAPYVRMGDKTNDSAKHVRLPAVSASGTYIHQKQTSLQQKIELNSADTLLLMQLPGIGSAYARHIIRYRERLGGFYTADQLKEISHIPDSIIQRVLPWVSIDTGLIRPMDLNTVQLGELAIHPYIGYALASLIIAYREQHGPYREVADLQKLVLVNEQIYRKLVHYLVVNPIQHASRSQ
ncbi:ComEA family DNA-binding protein [Thermoflavifilum thermophilum]|uniref:DNA uptake protein ComE n=1 Tax=Thermoflavifilum thermophilum TaxID=1393122 RepID=A0A1I7N538_9BACT|nr:helix-hairpin-helix domain-containing protein [Thermoflavifilum thermophilum]SFV29696.1 DNA uptake protein ComE [Thermoflavifilum thermophilum]